MASKPVPNPPDQPPAEKTGQAHERRTDRINNGRLELAEAKGGWQVQLGSYKDRRLAQVELSKLNHKFAMVLKAARGRVDRSDGNYRVRFAGLSADRAREACETIKAKGAGCLAVGPG